MCFHRGLREMLNKSYYKTEKSQGTNVLFCKIQEAEMGKIITGEIVALYPLMPDRGISRPGSTIRPLFMGRYGGDAESDQHAFQGGREIMWSIKEIHIMMIQRIVLPSNAVLML